MKEYTEEEILMLSGIQHFVFCRRQWALIHLENQWQENLKTTEGMLMHENAIMKTYQNHVVMYLLCVAYVLLRYH